MANSIDWGKIYCEMITNKGFGLDDDYTVGLSIHDGSAPVCWADSGLIPALSVDTNTIKVDSTLFNADATLRP